jgi:hypothetical protein
MMPRATYIGIPPGRSVQAVWIDVAAALRDGWIQQGD